MCGLAGEIRLDGRRADVVAVDRMAATMADRGPDDSGTWASGRVALAHRRLKIIDLSAASGQPIVDSAAGISGVFNGCIYNYVELREELTGKGHRFFSHGDSEVVLKAYAEWGEAFVDHLIGMFAVAIVERDTGRVVLARDRLGIKPLYVAESADTVRFASTLPALLAGGGIDTSIDTVALAHYMSFHAVVPPPRTILAGVRKLPPATVRVYEPDGTRSEHRYWDAQFTRDPGRSDWTETDWQDALAESLATAVRRRMVADVPVGVARKLRRKHLVLPWVFAEDGHSLFLAVAEHIYPRPLRPGVVRSPGDRGLRQNLELKEALASVTHGRGDAVGTRVSASQNYDVLILRRYVVTVTVAAVQKTLGVGLQKLHGKVNALKIPARNRQIARLCRPRAYNYGVVFL